VADTKDFDFDSFDNVGGRGGGIDTEGSFSLDLSDVPENLTFEALPPGIYDAIVDNVEFGHSQRSGNPMLTWTFKLQLPDGRERTQFYHTTLNEQGLPRLKRTLMRLKDYAPEPIDLTKFNPNTAGEKLIGTACRVRLRVQMYEGQKRNSVNDVLPPAADNAEESAFS
jgi:hypothetical protein